MRYKKYQDVKGFSFVEMMVVTLLGSIILTAGFLLLTSGQNVWLLTNTQIILQENLRKAAERLSAELSESGRDSSDVLQVSILDNAGAGWSDILRFSVPLCVCGVAVMDDDAEIRAWGAPLTWGQSGCQTDWTVNADNKVTICHVPPGNPGNTQTLDVAVSAVNAHLAHGDWIGACNSCNPASFTNKKVEYLLDTSGNLLRRVLDAGNNAMNSVDIAQNINDFQTSISGKVVTITMRSDRKALKNKTVTLSNSVEVILRNYD